MTSTVKRYSYGFHADGFGEGRTLGLIEKEDGNLVRFEEYELLREERDSFQRLSIRAMEERNSDAAARDQYRALSIKYGDKLSETLKERDALRDELEAVRGQQPNPDVARLREALQNARPYVADALSSRGLGMRQEAERRLSAIDAALAQTSGE